MKFNLAKTPLILISLLNIGGCSYLTSHHDAKMQADYDRVPSSVLNTKTDECEFIRQELRQLSGNGGEVVIPAGVYTCSSPIVLNKSNTALRGEGDVTLRLANDTNAPLLIMGNIETPPQIIENISVAHLNLDGNKDHQTSEFWGGDCDGGGTSVIRNNGITVRGVTNGNIKDVFIKNARSGGIVTEKICKDLVVDHLTSVDNFFDGFAGYETEGAELSHLVLSHNRAAGISLDIRFNGNHFNDVKIENDGDVGIFMRDSSNNIFEKVAIANVGSHGVFVAQSVENDDSTCPADNNFKDLSVINSKGLGFRLNDPCKGNIISGKSIFEGNQGECVSKAPGANIEIKGKLVCKK